MGELYPGSATLILSPSLDVASFALARKAGADKIPDKRAASEESIKRLGNSS